MIWTKIWCKLYLFNLITFHSFPFVLLWWLVSVIDFFFFKCDHIVHAFVIFRTIWHLILYFVVFKWIFALQRIEPNLIRIIWHMLFFIIFDNLWMKRRILKIQIWVWNGKKIMNYVRRNRKIIRTNNSINLSSNSTDYLSEDISYKWWVIESFAIVLKLWTNKCDVLNQLKCILLL